VRSPNSRQPPKKKVVSADKSNQQNLLQKQQRELVSLLDKLKAKVIN
jgi:hypothetical protein